MRRVAAFAPLLGLLAATAPLLAGCAQDLPSTAVIDKLRVIAVRAEPPEGPPGADVTLDALVVDPLQAQRQLEQTWFVCVPDRGHEVTSCLSFASDVPVLCVVDPEAPACIASVDEGATYRLPQRALAGRPEGEAGQVVITHVIAPKGTLKACADHFRDEGTPATDCHVTIKRLVVSRSAHPNHNPSLSDFRVDGMPVPALEAVTLPDLTSESKHTLSVMIGADSKETLDQPKNDLTAESLFLSYYTTDGKLDPARTDDTKAETTLTTPKGPEALKLFIVIHDGRGGVAWTSGRVRVLAP